MRLRPDPLRAAVWTALAALLVGATIWMVLDSAGAWPAWVAVAVAACLAAWFLVQLVAPELVTLSLDADRMSGRILWVHVDLPWDRVLFVRVTSVLGDPMLSVSVAEPLARRAEQVGLLLPVGADVAGLHAFLEHRLGRVAST